MVRARHDLEVFGETRHLGGGEGHVRITESEVIEPMLRRMDAGRVDDQTVTIHDLTVHGIHRLFVLLHVFGRCTELCAESG